MYKKNVRILGTVTLSIAVCFFLMPFPTFAESLSPDLWKPFDPQSSIEKTRMIADALRKWSVVSGSHLALWRAEMLRQRGGEERSFSAASELLPAGQSPLLSHLRPGTENDLFYSALPTAYDYLSSLTVAPESSQPRQLNTLPAPGVPPPIMLPSSAPFSSTGSDVDPSGTIPDLFSYAPPDSFILYAKDITRLGDASLSLDEFFHPLFSPWVSLTLERINDRILDRFGIADADAFFALSGEMLFISDDPSYLFARPSALIIRTNDKGQALRQLLDPRAALRIDGDIVIVASDKAMLSRIVKGIGSKRKKNDDSDILRLLDDGDIILYYPTLLAERLLSPSGFVSQARRSLADVRLDTLQYATLSYRSITGQFPSSMPVLLSGGYIHDKRIMDIDPGFMAFLHDVRIESDGVVVHPEYGSLYNPLDPPSVASTPWSQWEYELYEKMRSDPTITVPGTLRGSGLALLEGEHLTLSYFSPDGRGFPLLEKLLSVVNGPDRPIGSTYFPVGEYPILAQGSFALDKFLLSSHITEDFRSRTADILPGRSDHTALSQRVNTFVARTLSWDLVTSTIDPFLFIGANIGFGIPPEVDTRKHEILLPWIIAVDSSDPEGLAHYLSYLFDASLRMIDAAPPPPPPVVRRGDISTLFLPIPDIPLYGLFTKSRAYLTNSREENDLLAVLLNAKNESPRLSSRQSALLGETGSSGFFSLVAENRGISLYLQRMIIDPESIWGSRAIKRISEEIGYLSDVRGSALILGHGEAGEKFFPFVPSTIVGSPIRVAAEHLALGGFTLSDSRSQEGVIVGPTLPEIYSPLGAESFFGALNNLQGFALTLAHEGRSPGFVLRMAIATRADEATKAPKEQGAWHLFVIVVSVLLVLFVIIGGGVAYRRYTLRRRTIAQTVADRISD